MAERTDAELVSLARAGDKAAFGELALRHQAMARRVARRMVGSDDLAESMAQEAVLQAYLSLDRLRDPARFEGWLYGIVLNVCRRLIRDERGGHLSWEALAGGLPVELCGLDEWAPRPEDVVEERELHRLVRDAVGALPPATRSVTLLFYYQGRTQQEIAALLGISVSAVKVRLYRARQTLRERLLAADSERGEAAERRKAMIGVQVVDVVRRRTGDREQHVVVLYDAEGERVLPIWVGRFEAEMLALQIAGRSAPRPLTYDLMGKLLEAVGAVVEEVSIQSLQGNVYHAAIRVRLGDLVRELDGRPSDALNLALRVGAPTYASEQVMEQMGAAVPAGAGAVPSGKGAQSIVAEQEEAQRAIRTHRERREAARIPEQTQQELMTWLFDVDAGRSQSEP